MTMVAFRVQPDCAEILTDSLAYDANCLNLAPSAKVTVLAPLDTAVIAQGPTHLAMRWKGLLCGPTGDFDHLDEAAQEHLPTVWAQMEGEERLADGPGEHGAVFHVGYSPRHRRFKAYAYSSLDAFRSTDLTEHALFCMPPPTSAIARVPAADEDWVALAKTVHDEWALAPLMSGLQVPIGGDVIHTRLDVGAAVQRRLHRFPNAGRDFRTMLIGSLHPAGQLGPCVCGSGRPFMVCHLDTKIDCPCKSGKRLEDCHRVDPAGPQARQHWREHAADFRRTRDDLAAAYRWWQSDESWRVAHGG